MDTRILSADVTRSASAGCTESNMLVAIFDNGTASPANASTRQVSVRRAARSPLSASDVPANAVHVGLVTVDVAEGTRVDLVAVGIEVAFANLGLIGANNDLTGERIVASVGDLATRIVDFGIEPTLSGCLGSEAGGRDGGGEGKNGRAEGFDGGHGRGLFLQGVK